MYARPYQVLLLSKLRVRLDCTGRSCAAAGTGLQMQIDDRAPVVAHHEIEIFAPPEKVWDWLSRVDLWASWRQDVSSAEWVEGYGPNATIKWRVGKLMGVTARVESWSETRELGWRAGIYGGEMLQVLRMSGDFKRTFVTSDLSCTGGLTRLRLTRAYLRSRLNRTNEIWLGSLKTKLEAGKDDFRRPPPSRKNPFENNVNLPSQRDKFST